VGGLGEKRYELLRGFDGGFLVKIVDNFD